MGAPDFPRDAFALNLLAFDTSTEVLTVAARAGDAGEVHEFAGAGGAESSATLLPAIHDVLARAGLSLRSLDAICFGCGPGSFTGLRTACAVAQGLGFGAALPVLPVDTLTLVAESARAATGETRVVAVLDARMGDVYVAQAEWDGAAWAVTAPALCRPEAVLVPAGWALAGNAFMAHGASLPKGPLRIDAFPTAAALLRIAPALLTAGHAVPAVRAAPLYVRDKVAQTTDERAADRARKDAALAAAGPSGVRGKP